MRLRLVYSKTGGARFFSTVEMVDIFSQAVRRAGLPIAFTEGHHPKPRMRFGPGLPVGVESDCEVVDIDLSAAPPPQSVAEALSAQLPGGLRIVRAEELPLGAPPIERILRGFRYLIDLGEVLPVLGGHGIDKRFSAFIEAATFPISRHSGRGDRVRDARPLVARLERVGEARARLDALFTPRGTVKPSDLLAAVLHLDEPTARALPIRKIRWFCTGEVSGAVSRSAPAPEGRPVAATVSGSHPG